MDGYQTPSSAHPHAAVVDAQIQATGMPNRFNRRRLRKARILAAQAATVALEALITEHQQRGNQSPVLVGAV